MIRNAEIQALNREEARTVEGRARNKTAGVAGLSCWSESHVVPEYLTSALFLGELQ